jgi:hypothetical protein
MTTLQLYDADEGYWHPKLHVGCGGVYLAQYINIDVQGVHTSEVDKEQLLKNTRFITDYYQKLDGTWDSLPKANPVIADLICPMQDLDKHFQPGSIKKIVAIQTMEHLDPLDFIHTLDTFYTLLENQGTFIISVPDMAETIQWLYDPLRVGFTIRHLRGSLKDEWSKHKSWWTGKSLVKTLEWIGFKHIYALLNFHCYPALVLKAIKSE